MAYIGAKYCTHIGFIKKISNDVPIFLYIENICKKIPFKEYWFYISNMWSEMLLLHTYFQENFEIECRIISCQYHYNIMVIFHSKEYNTVWILDKHRTNIGVLSQDIFYSIKWKKNGKYYFERLSYH